MICFQRRITADKRKIFDFPKLPSATSHIRRTLSEIPNSPLLNKSNLNHLNRAWLRSQKRGKNIGSIASQPNITEVKRLHFVPTQIFNNSKKGVFRFKKKKENTYIHLWTLGYECDYHGFKECDPQC